MASPRVHQAHFHDVGVEVCPLCGQPIPPDKLVEIQQRERERAEAQAKQLRGEFEREKATALANKQAELDRFRAAAAATAQQAKQESEKRETAARAEAKTQAENAMKARVEEADTARKAAEDHLKQVKEEQQHLAEEQLKKALHEQRESMEKAKTEAIQREQAKAFEDRQKMEAELGKLQRQVKKQRADELGEAAELDLEDALREAFTDDRFHTIDKGVAGADLWQDVVYSGEVCGRIVYDSKNRAAWRNEYVDKLKVDQVNAEGDYAVLATRVFPVGARQLHVQDRVILVHPARVVAVVMLLREQIIQTHRTKLSAQQRETKTEALYDFINSERCHQIFEHFETLIDDMLDLDVTEKKQHEKNWNKRGHLIKKAQRAIQVQLQGEINRIIEGN